MARPAFALGLCFFASVVVACGGQHGKSICDNQVPAPAACMTTCDPQPGAPNTCPAGYHCTEDGMCDALCTVNGNECGDGYHCTPDGRCVGDDSCVGLQCQVVDCAKQNMPPTTISGKVFAPNGTLPLYGVDVYVPNTDPGPFTEGAQCTRCNQVLPGDPVVQTQTAEDGTFTLSGVPSGQNIPLIVTIGKWRKKITIPTVNQCADNPLAATETRLPKNKSEGDIPKIAITTGSADALECLIRKLGIEDSEITNESGTGRINLFTDSGAGGGQGAKSIQGGGNMSDAAGLWGSLGKLMGYDIVIFSCEGGQHPETKPQAAMNNVKMYADLGGRVFTSHWHNIWIEGSTQGGGNQAPAIWKDIATWNNSGTTFSNPPDTIDEIMNPKGMSFATWMLNVGGSPTRGAIPIGANTGKQTCTAVDPAKAERWVYWQNGGTQFPQNFQFTTPNETAPENRCGKVVFSDMHVSGDSSSDPGTAFPGSCAASALTPQEKALAFMFFDISSCVGPPIGRTVPEGVQPESVRTIRNAR